MATQNIPFNIVRPNVATLLPEGTDINARIRTFSGNSPDGNLEAFVDQGYEPISLANNNYLSTPRIVASKQNELDKLVAFEGRKSHKFLLGRFFSLFGLLFGTESESSIQHIFAIFFC